MNKLLLLDDWIKAIDELIGFYKKGLNPVDFNCPLCIIHSSERELQGIEGSGGACFCPWNIFFMKGEEISCYSEADFQSKEERLARLKDWKRRILRMKKRRKK